MYALGILIMEIYAGYVERKAWKGEEAREANAQSVGTKAVVDSQMGYLMSMGFRLRPVEELKDDPGSAWRRLSSSHLRDR